MNLNIVFDMKGCPNRCKHCWLGHMENKNLHESDASFVVDKFSKYYDKITFYSWLRESDFCQDYRDRWNKDIKLSSGNKPIRFELASFYKIVREPDYVNFLKEVGTKKVQLTFFGMKDLTDKYVGRKGAFDELVRATDILIKNGITPRWQAFINQENKDEIVSLLDLIDQLEIKERCKDFSFFVHAGSCDGENAKLYNIRINKKDIPSKLVPYYLDYENVATESELYNLLINNNGYFVPSNDNDITLNITNTFDVYFNFTHINESWKIGNLKTDNMEEIVRRINEEDILALQIARKIPLSKLVSKYGDKNSDKVFEIEDFEMYLLNRHLEHIT